MRPGIPIERGHAFRTKAATCSDEGGRGRCRHEELNSGFLGGVKLGALCGDLAHAVSLECEAVSVVNEAVEDGVGDGGIGDDLVPVVDRHLAGDDGRTALMAVIDHFEEIATLIAGEGSKPPIVEYEKIDTRERLEEASIASVAASERESLEQPWKAMIKDGAIVTAGLVAERASDSTLAGPGRPGDQEVLLAVDPVAVDELGEEGTVDAARGAQIDVFDDRGLPQRCKLQAGHKSSVLTLGDLAIDHEAKPLLEVECVGVWLPQLIVESLGHSREA